jgi:hypothetical protein
VRLWIDRTIPRKAVGCPIRTSEDHRALAPPLGFSQRATSFIASRYQGIHQMPFMCCVRAQPRARASGSSGPQGGSPKNARVQRTEDRRQRTDKTPPTGRDVCLLCTVTCSSGPLRTRQPRRCSRIGTHTHAPGPTSPHLSEDESDGRTCFTVTTRFTISTEQRTENRAQTTRSAAPILRHNSRFPTPEDVLRDSCPLPPVLRHLNLVGLGRFERPTSRLSGVRSDQLSYRPKIRDQRTEQMTDQAQRREPSCRYRICSLISVLCPLTWKGCVDGDPGPPALQTTDKITAARPGGLSSVL